MRALEAMREEHGRRIKRQGKTRFSISEGERSGRKVIEARSITHCYNNETLIHSVKLKIMRGDRIGLIGNNGVGKSTLLKVLSGAHRADVGDMRIDGKPFRPKGPSDARNQGVAHCLLLDPGSILRMQQGLRSVQVGAMSATEICTVTSIKANCM